MIHLKAVVITIALIVLAGCSDPKIDVSSDEIMKNSIEEVRMSLPESKQIEFDEALQLLMFSQIEFKNIFTEGIVGIGDLEKKVRQSLDGKTGVQVIAEAKQIRDERKKRERQQALAEIQELEKKQIKSKNARVELKKFKVVRSRFYVNEQKYFGKQPIIELTVENGTNQAISRAYFEGTLASPGRSVPWHKDEFNYKIPGGLEPKEKATWSLTANMFSNWGTINFPVDAVFTVTVEQLDGADGEPIYSTKEFSERDIERLNELKEKYGIE